MKKLQAVIIGIIIFLGPVGAWVAYDNIVAFLTPQKNGSTEIVTTSKFVEICVSKCKELLSANQDLGKGPCILNLTEKYPDWVCDVVHFPRQLVDDQSENQCSAFRNGLASHFVEVSTNCNLVRSQ